MKKLFFVFLIVHCTFNIENCSAQWVQMSTVQDFLSLSLNGNNIIAGNVSGIYISTNTGLNWTQTFSPSYSVECIAISNNNIFATTDGNGIYRSTNNGSNWSQTGLNSGTFFSLAIRGNNIVAGSYNNGVYLSTNNGLNWTQTAMNNKTVYSLIFYGNAIFAGTYDQSNTGAVNISTNYGGNWTQTSLNNQNIYCFDTTSSKIFAGTAFSVYSSTNNGTNWTQTTLNNGNVFSLAISGDTIFAGTYSSGVYMSTNNGINWAAKNQGFVSLPVIEALLIANNYIFAGTSQGIWRRTISNILSSSNNVSSEISSEFSLMQNYPNPFNPSTIIRFSIPENGKRKMENGLISLKVFDVTGKEVATLINEILKAGIYEVTFEGGNLSSGIYFYQLKTDNFIETKKLILLK